MKKQTYTCEMIEDLIPLAAEGLCSEESRKAVQTHIAECDRCRALYENPVQPETAKADIPDETKTFRKVYRKIAKSRRLNKILGVLLGIIAVPLAVLAFGSITENEIVPSFEGLHQDYRVYRIAKSFAEGDFEPYLRMAHDYDDLIFSQPEEVREQIIRDDTAFVRVAYDKYAAGKKLRTVFVHTAYEGNGYSPEDWTGMLGFRSHYLNSTAYITFTDGTKITLVFADRGDGRLISAGYEPNEDEAGHDLAQGLMHALWFAESHKSQHLPFVESCFEHEMQTIPENRENRLNLMANRFAPEYHDRLHDAFDAFYAQGFRTPELMLSELHYDAEKHLFYHEAALTAEDSRGSAVLMTRFYESADGLIPPEQDECTVHGSGCTPELTASLAQLFG